MKIFELYFNPKKKQDSIFDSFVYEPEGFQEKQSGSLCMAGELSKTISRNKDFLDNLADSIKEEFYSKGDFSESLKGANSFLDMETKSGNVDWLGNLNFAVVNIKDSILNFTKVGNVKILLLRGGEVLDISQNLELQDQEPYPLKVFSNMACGKLLNQDKIIILSEEVFSAISRDEDFLDRLGKINKEKDLKEVFKQNRHIFSEISGICLLITQENTRKAGIMPSIKIVSPFPKISKRGVLIITLILIIAIAYFLFGNEREEKVNQIQIDQKKLEEARSKIMMAENLIIIKKEEKSRALFQEAWDLLSPLTEFNSSVRKEAASLQESIEKYLGD